MNFVIPKDYGPITIEVSRGFLINKMTVLMAGQTPLDDYGEYYPYPPNGIATRNSWTYSHGYWHCESKNFIHFNRWPECPRCHVNLHRQMADSKTVISHGMKVEVFKHLACGAELLIWRLIE